MEITDGLRRDLLELKRQVEHRVPAAPQKRHPMFRQFTPQTGTRLPTPPPPSRRRPQQNRSVTAVKRPQWSIP